MIRRFTPFATRLGLAALLLASGCAAGGSDATTGKRVLLHTTMAASPATFEPFTTGFGWDVTLARARVASTAFYYFDGPPPTALYRPRPPSLGERFASLLVSTAWAHPGHYQAGTALGQAVFPGPLVLDLFGDLPRALPDGEGVTGTYRSARFVLPEAPPADPVLDGHVAVAEGTAAKHDGSSGALIHFRLVADWVDVSASVNDGAVDGCVLDETTVDGDGTVTLAIEPTIWLNLVDFSKLAPGSDDAPTEAHDAGFSQGVTELSAYHFSYRK